LRTIASLGDADDVVKALVETESGVILDVDINMCTSMRFPRLILFGEYGTAALEADGQTIELRYYRPQELPEKALQEGLAAADRRYCLDADVPWVQETVEVGDFEPVDFYAKCYDYYAKDAAPFVPVGETREVMRTLELCRQASDCGLRS
jgi:hypothetical protein